MNVRIILALTVPLVMVLVIVGAILADGNVGGEALEIADELLGIIGVILGGIGTLHGPVLGAFAFAFLNDWLQEVTEHPTLFMGLFVVFVVLFLPRGIAGLPGDLARWRRRRTSPPGDPEA